MSKEKIQKSKKQTRKNLFMQITVVVVIVAFAAYFILSNVLVTRDTTNKELDRAVQKSTVYEFQKEGELTFNNTKNDFISKLDIEIADDEQSRETGLMFRDKMEQNQGMLFLFPKEDMQAFWMKNTILPLDIIFVNSKMEIVKIQKNAVPYSEKSLPSVKPAQYVVEVNAGYCDKLGISEGDKIVWRRE
ncbi:MAG: DUF192 domain-containing protein [Bacteroidota bacterium]